ncbi:hypothetical protein FBY41_3267 [Humibacillus xanthopallidus]|uniref:Uncharacterized protein n=1 Tax=Humibacillus xanthopallidus TaxID=412689 RepID=A0A543HHY5_9MICO|nr:hypothetical protein FBY41_3267 [Humibacillus xanthopallidus]
MSDHVVSSTEPYDPDVDSDTDSTMTAPEGGRPDGAPPMAGAEAGGLKMTMRRQRSDTACSNAVTPTRRRPWAEMCMAPQVRV